MHGTVSYHIFSAPVRRISASVLLTLGYSHNPAAAHKPPAKQFSQRIFRFQNKKEP
jgi:hypothetical protein